MKGCKFVVWIFCVYQFLILMPCLAQQVSTKPCPSANLKHCICGLDKEDNTIISVNCTNTELVGDSLELDIPDTVTTFIFNGNLVEKLKPDFIQQCSNTGLPSIKKLDLSRNKIKTIHEDFFKCFPGLEELSLNKDNLYFNESTKPMLNNLENLKVLEMQEAFYYNSNEYVYSKEKGRNSSVVHITEVEHVFNGNGLLPNLRTLHLENNKLWYIDSNALCDNMPNLENLYLSHNHIQPKNMDISCLSNLKILHLDNNEVGWLDDSFIKQLNNAAHLTELNLTENAWLCDCNFHNTLEWLQSDSSSDIVLNKKFLWCYVERERQYIVNISASDLTCEYVEPMDKRLKKSYIVLGCVFAAIGVMFLIVLFLNRDKIIRFGKRCFDPFINYNPNAHHRNTYSSVAV